MKQLSIFKRDLQAEKSSRKIFNFKYMEIDEAKETRDSSVVPAVAVCLAAFNGERWLPEQLRSVLEQTGVSVTVFVSVDRSSDNTEAWFDQLASADSRVISLAHGEKFGGASRNFFRIMREIDFSEFDYISFADQDDIWFPDKLLRAHQVLSTTGADAYSSNVIAFWKDNRRVLVQKSQQQVQWDFLFEAAGPGCTYVLRRELGAAIQKVLQEHWSQAQNVGHHDWFFYAFARANGYCWVIDEGAKMLYRQHDSNEVGINSGIKAFAVRTRKVLNGWGFRQSALIAVLVGLGDDPFVTKWSRDGRMGMFKLSLHFWQCRRNVRDKFLFALSCLAVGIKGNHRR